MLFRGHQSRRTLIAWVLVASVFSGDGLEGRALEAEAGLESCAEAAKPEVRQTTCLFDQEKAASSVEDAIGDLRCHWLSNATKEDLVCDNVTEWTPILNLDIKTLTINGTSLAVVPDCAIPGAAIDQLFITWNSLLEDISPNAFDHVETIREITVMDNNVLAIRSHMLEPFAGVDGLETLIIASNHKNRPDFDQSPTTSKKLARSLQYLSFHSNPLGNITVDFFQPLQCSHVTELSLRNCQLENIDEGAFDALPLLETVDLSKNQKLIHKAEMAWVENLGWTSLVLAENMLVGLPPILFTDINETLIQLDLTNNRFYSLPVFPDLGLLESLILDDCKIDSVDDGVFENLPSLKNLSMLNNQLTVIPPAILVPSLVNLHLKGFSTEYPLYINEEIFFGMENLKTLTLSKFFIATNEHDTGLNTRMFQGLLGLLELDLSESHLTAIEDNTFNATPSLKKLSMAHCTGLESVPVEALRGPDCLEEIDLTDTTIFRSDKNSNMLASPDSPLGHIKVLNLTHSMFNIEKPMDRLGLDLMPNLEKLDIGENKIVGWNETKFGANPKLAALYMSNNFDSMILTAAMLEDFRNLSTIDLSRNTFVCNEFVRLFYKMVEKDKLIPEVIGWRYGFGYECCCGQQDQVTSFSDFTGEAGNIDKPAYPNDEGWDNILGGDKAIQQLVLSIAGGVTFLAFVVLAAFTAYKNKWSIRLKIIQIRRRHQRRERVQAGDFDYDAFISYAASDHDWVQEHLVPNMEPNFRLCIHERDFVLGRSIVDNIVECLEKSRTTLLVLSEAYVKSEWCRFEVQVAMEMMPDKVVAVVLEESGSGIEKRKDLSKSLKMILKSRTYINWNNDEAEMSLGFWRKLGKAIGVSQPEENGDEKDLAQHDNNMIIGHNHQIKKNAFIILQDNHNNAVKESGC